MHVSLLFSFIFSLLVFLLLLHNNTREQGIDLCLSLCFLFHTAFFFRCAILYVYSATTDTTTLQCNAMFSNTMRIRTLRNVSLVFCFFPFFLVPPPCSSSWIFHSFFWFIRLLIDRLIRIQILSSLWLSLAVAPDAPLLPFSFLYVPYDNEWLLQRRRRWRLCWCFSFVEMMVRRNDAHFSLSQTIPTPKIPTGSPVQSRRQSVCQPPLDFFPTYLLAYLPVSVSFVIVYPLWPQLLGTLHQHCPENIHVIPSLFFLFFFSVLQFPYTICMYYRMYICCTVCIR